MRENPKLETRDDSNDEKSNQRRDWFAGVDVVKAALECRKEIRISKSETSSNNGKSGNSSNDEKSKQRRDWFAGVDVVEAALECRKEIRISKSETSSNNGKSDKPRSEDGEAVVVGAEGEDVLPGVAGVGGEMGGVGGLDGGGEDVDEVVVLLQAQRQYHQTRCEIRISKSETSSNNGKSGNSSNDEKSKQRRDWFAMVDVVEAAVLAGKSRAGLIGWRYGKPYSVADGQYLQVLRVVWVVALHLLCRRIDL
jgi:hypothetical protein